MQAAWADLLNQCIGIIAKAWWHFLVIADTEAAAQVEVAKLVTLLLQMTGKPHHLSGGVAQWLDVDDLTADMAADANQFEARIAAYAVEQRRQRRLG